MGFGYSISFDRRGKAGAGETLVKDGKVFADVDGQEVFNDCFVEGVETVESVFYEREQAPSMDPTAPASWSRWGNCEISILIGNVSSLDCNVHLASLGGIDGVKVGIKRKTLNLGRTPVASCESLCNIGRQRLVLVDPCFRNTGEWVSTAILRQTDNFPNGADGAVEVSAMCTVGVFAIADEPDVLR